MLFHKPPAGPNVKKFKQMVVEVCKLGQIMHDEGFPEGENYSVEIHVDTEGVAPEKLRQTQVVEKAVKAAFPTPDAFDKFWSGILTFGVSFIASTGRMDEFARMMHEMFLKLDLSGVKGKA